MSVFKSGNSDIPSCQSACYNLFPRVSEKDGNVAYRAPSVFYSENQSRCLLYSNDLFMLAADDYRRTDKHPTPRVDTIGTGFDLMSEPFVNAEKNETFQFKLNKYYYDDFQYNFNGVECKPSIFEWVTSILASSNLYKLVQYTDRYIGTALEPGSGGGVWVNDVQRPKLPPIQMKTPPSEAEWRAQMNPDAIFFNPNLTLSDLGITKDRMDLIFTTEYGWPGRLVEPLLIYKTPDESGDTNEADDFTGEILRVNFLRRNEKLLPQFSLQRCRQKNSRRILLATLRQILSRNNRKI